MVVASRMNSSAPLRVHALHRTFAVLVISLSVMAVVAALVLLPAPPWTYYSRARELGWWPVRWSQPMLGRWTSGFERSVFLPCPSSAGGVSDTSAVWADVRPVWLTLRSRVWGTSPVLSDTTVLVAWYADVSDNGQFGHLGQYRRAIGVRSIAGVWPVTQTDCDAASRDSTLFWIE